MQTLIALDLETTGLDPRRDSILEIGAIRFRGGRVIDEFQTLINPGVPIPPFVQQLTGINDAMVAGAPRLSAVAAALESFVGDLPILGHNVAFDVGFLRQARLFELNETVDTFDLASVLMPANPRYTLASLVAQLSIPVRRDDLHRALQDADATRLVYLRLVELAADLPLALLEEIVHLGQEIEWGGGLVFEQALETRRAEQPPDTDITPRWVPGFKPLRGPLPTLSPTPEPTALDAEEISAVAEPGGELFRHFPGYEHRAQQVMMLESIARAFSEGQHLLIEAGTGVGKSIAYLVPAFAWAEQNGRRVVISTNTINLQDQLINKDVPNLAAALGKDFRAAVLKGRSNYLCPRRLEAWRRLGLQTANEIRVLAKVMVWLEQGGSGDRNEINLHVRGEGAVWSRLSAENSECSGEACLRTTGGACPYFTARQQAESAHVVIVNHALLLADIVTGNRVLPEYEYLIIDEAHHLENATTDGLSMRVSERELSRLLGDLRGGPSSLLSRIAAVGRGRLQAEISAELDRRTSELSARVIDCQEIGTRFFESLSEYMRQRRDGKPLGNYSQRERVLPGHRSVPDWEMIEISWENFRSPLGVVIKQAAELAGGLLELEEQGVDEAGDLGLAIQGLGDELETIHKNLEAIIFEPQVNGIYWIEVSDERSSPTLHVAPLEVGPLVEKHLWHEKESVIMTSATLTTHGEFDYLRSRLSAVDADELALGSPFDYESSTLLYLVNDIPEPSFNEPYQRALEVGLEKLCLATGGRTLVLFTSRAHLQRTSSAISSGLESKGIRVISQLEGTPRNLLLETFRDAERAVLLGTRSFWEGVDVPGEALSVVAIVRLPFDVPSDPIIAARSETYERAFDQYTVPEAILRFRQGFGRLIRSRADRGAVVIFDKRLLSKSYGAAFIQSLPGPTVRQGTLANLPAQVARWLGS